MRKAAGPAAGSGHGGAGARRGPGLSSAGRNIVGAPKTVGTSAASPRPSSQGCVAKAASRPTSRGSTIGTRRLVSTPLVARPTPKAKLASAAEAAFPGPDTEVVSLAAEETALAERPPDLDAELRDAVLGVFRWCDADADGVLNAAEYAASQRLIAELCSSDFDEEAASAIFDSASDGGVGGLVDEEDFLRAMQKLVNALNLPRRKLLSGLTRQTSKRSTTFDRSVRDFKNALVRNVSNMPEEPPFETGAPPPELELWRTDTGGHSFSFPPGAVDESPSAQIAFKLMQFLGMRTEDSSFIDAGLAAKMLGHRQMFQNILNMCGDIKGVEVVTLGPGAITVDLFLAKSMGAEEMFRIRMTGIELRTAPTAKLIAMGGFEPAPIEVSEIPPALLKEMQIADSGHGPDLSALGQAPPPPGITRQKSLMCEADLQSSDLVLTSAPVGRHLFRIRFKLAESPLGVAPNYLLLLPRIKTTDTGHARYADHAIRVDIPGVGMQPNVKTFNSFVLASIRGHTLNRLVVEHEFTSCQVRVQERSAARRSHIVPVPKLSQEERAHNLASDVADAQRLRQLLQSKGLARRDGERDIAFAVRLGRALCKGYEYDVDITEANIHDLTSLIWDKGRGDCSAFNAGFVYALRAFDVPARVSLGFKYGQAVKQACGAVAAPHAEAEFYAEGIGWVPCDATLGLKRLGHSGGAALTFVEWRPANLNLEEAEELAQVLQPPQHLDYKLLQKEVEELAGGDTATAKELAHFLAKLQGLTKDQADLQVTQVLRLCDLEGQPRIPVGLFARGWATVELGKFSELGAGGGLISTAKAGAKFYEGGPFKESPLELRSLKENMMVPDDVEKVLETVGGRPVTHDWSSMWPYGVFLCNYEFEEKPFP